MSLLAVAPLSAQPIPDATPEAILCTASYVATGRVVEAVNADCRAEPRVEGCVSDNVVDLKVEIIEFMGFRQAIDPPLQRGAVVAIRVKAFPRRAITAIPPPPKPLLSDRKIQDAYAGKTFIFSVTTADRPGAGPDPADVWPMSEKIWVLDTMNRQPAADCPRRL
jgi:hypothetical protein